MTDTAEVLHLTLTLVHKGVVSARAVSNFMREALGVSEKIPQGNGYLPFHAEHFMDACCVLFPAGWACARLLPSDKSMVVLVDYMTASLIDGEPPSRFIKAWEEKGFEVWSVNYVPRPVPTARARSLARPKEKRK